MSLAHPGIITTIVCSDPKRGGHLLADNIGQIMDRRRHQPGVPLRFVGGTVVENTSSGPVTKTYEDPTTLRPYEIGPGVTYVLPVPSVPAPPRDPGEQPRQHRDASGRWRLPGPARR